MPKEIKFTCPLDCFDLCALVASVEGGRVVKVRGNKQHPLTRGFCCRKGLQHLERLYHPQRLRTPLKKTGNGWVPVSWDTAFDEMAHELGRCLAQYGSAAVMHYAASGYGGLVKKVDEVFFNYLGGATVPRGSLCWGAGIAAQTYDFGAVRGHPPQDMARARTIVLWGRNPVDTNVHLVPFIREAKQNGARIILVDPRQSASAKLADIHIAVRPGTDGALALGIAHVVVNNGWHDRQFLKDHTLGFERFRESLKDFTPQRVTQITGITEEVIAHTAKTCALDKPACIIVGLGLQRYLNGGNTVRCIDALGAVTGNIGISGGGVNYANKVFPPYIAGEFEKSKRFARNRRTFPVAKLAEYLNAADNPPIRCLFVLKANPLVQTPDIQKALNAFEKIPFKVAIDMFMTDTARHCDLVLPCSSVLEEEDIIFTSMFSPYIHFSAKVVDPPPGVKSEYDLFKELAVRMGLSNYPRKSRRMLLEEAILPLLDTCGLDYESLRQRDFLQLPQSEIPWEAGLFETPSGKYEFFSKQAQKDGQSPLPVFTAARQGDTAYPLRLLTPHWRGSMHSQHFAFIDDIPTAHIHPESLQGMAVAADGRADVVSPQGRLAVKIRPDARVPEGVVMIYQGWWHKSGAVNFLTAERLSDMGEQAAYYDTFCRIEPADLRAD